MEAAGLSIQRLDDGIAVKIRVQPRASRNRIAGIYNDSLKVALTSPPVDGEANQACIDFLARLLSIPKSRITISSGHKSRNKTVKISGSDISAILSKLTILAAGD